MDSASLCEICETPKFFNLFSDRQKMDRVAIVTGSNRGIGYETVRGLAKTGDFKIVYLTAIDPELGAAAVNKLNTEENFDTVKFHQLDIRSEQSITALASFISVKHGGFDVLVQNAGFAFSQDATEPFHVQIVSLDKNLTKNVVKKFHCTKYYTVNSRLHFPKIF